MIDFAPRPRNFRSVLEVLFGFVQLLQQMAPKGAVSHKIVLIFTEILRL